MPIYVEMQTESNNEFFPKCGTKEVAKGVSNTSLTAGDNAIIAENYSFSAVSEDNGLNNVSFHFSVTVPAYAPAIASAFNVLNGRDKVKNFSLKVVGVNGVGLGRNSLIKTYTGEDGVLTSVNLDEDNKENGSLTLHLVFEKMTFDNSVTHTSGIIKTVDGGY